MASSLVATGVQFPDNSIQTTAAASPIPTGTVMLFVQTAAPTGWTKSTANDNKALRVVSGTASSGGSVNFTTAFASQAVNGTVGNHTLTIAQMPSHTHDFFTSGGGATQNRFNISPASSTSATTSVTATGGGGSHNHSFSGTAINLAVQYVDVIIATKN
jgi:microcystin-dependent protein